jgi:hypothetical protein
MFMLLNALLAPVHVRVLLCPAANIDHAPLQLGGFNAQHILGSTRDIARKVAAHYVSQTLRELYKVPTLLACPAPMP